MARMGLFGRRTADRDGDGVPDRLEARDDDRGFPDRDGDGVDDRRQEDERRLAEERRRLERERKGRFDKSVDRDGDGVADHRDPVVDRDRDGVDDRAQRQPVAAPVATAPPVVDRDRDGVDDRVQDRPERKWRARASILATLALMVGLTSVYASLSGRLAPAGIALGVLGLLFAIGGLSATGRPKVAGGGMATFALLLSLAGAVFGILAVNHTTSWLDSDVDQIARWRDWLDTQFTFIQGW